MNKDKHRSKNKFKVVDTKRSRVDYPRKDQQEEFAAEITPSVPVTAPVRDKGNDRKRDESAEGSTGRVAGYVGLILGIAALFMWSVILGPIAAVTGYYAYTQGSRTLGAWSIGLGILATISYFVLIPFAR
ncbi:hypothetical protein [Paenibacillus sp. DMB20]|uniref:hypothetical protein n=1 Tax=Paenibacillus sp. DMB20 TaxID=1642570 RepID=UPI0006279AAF|nr:hypothetical protein [Paenibacillus sp. DMB20]KKO51508.1 hypothetical protein XI25_25760 [Paenibacillus sp. DMB20]